MLSLHKCVMAAIILLAVSAVSSASAKLPAGAESAPSRFKVVWKEGRLSVTAEHASLSLVLGEIAKQTGLEIRGGQALKREVSATFSSVSLPEGLHQLLGPMNYVLLEKAPSQERGRTASALLVIASDDGGAKSHKAKATSPTDGGTQGNPGDSQTAQGGGTQQGANAAGPVTLPPALPSEGVNLATNPPAPAMIPDQGAVLGSSRSGPVPLPENGVNLGLQQSQGGEVQMGK